MFNRKFLLLAVIAMLIFAAACSNNNNNAEGNEAGGNNEEDLEEVTITYWVDQRFKLLDGMEDQTQDYGDYEELQAQAFMDLHPHVTVEVQSLTWDDLPTKVPIAVRGGTQPDVLKDYLGRTAGYAHQGVLVDLSEHIPQEELDDYLDTYIDLYTIEGELHALPSYTWASSMVVNRGLWEEVGQADLLPTYDDPTWTMDEFMTAAEAIHSDDVFPIGIQMASEQGDNGLLAWFWAHGAKLYEDGDYSKTALNSPEGVEALTRLVELNDAGMLQPSAVSATMTEVDTYFYRGEMGMFMGADSGYWNKYNTAEKEGQIVEPHDPVLLKQPDVEGSESGLYVGPTGFAVFKQDDEYRTKWAIEFARFLNSPDYQKEYALNSGQFPTRASVDLGDELAPQNQATQELLERFGTEDTGLTTPHFAEIRPLLQPIVQQALLKQLTPEEALAEYEKQANAVLSQ